MRVLVVGDRGDDDPGYVGERLLGLGATLSPLDRDALPKFAHCGPADLVCLLGSFRAAYDPAHREPVAAEIAFVRAAMDARVPVLGICYGAQLLALLLGGTVEPLSKAEVGWCEVDSVDEVLCPPGPWLQFHRDTFRPPAGVRVLGSSWAGCQGIAYEHADARAVAWQFHPEVTVETLEAWLATSAEFVRANGAHAEAMAAESRSQADQHRDAAHDLTDAALKWLGVPA